MVQIAGISVLNGINRIRLEFKGFALRRSPNSTDFVLIESDWNLKTAA